MNLLGQKIKKLRQEKNVNQASIAKEMGISLPAYSKIETGKTDVNISRLEQLASIHKIDIGEFFCDGLKEQLKEKDEQIAILKDKLIESLTS
ncbi:MAG: helix-turn-helix transcriptional regulator [Pedobacter sp.]|nr:helix-turn-helix transcriptional regulator [Pedobacter sp.]